MRLEAGLGRGQWRHLRRRGVTGPLVQTAGDEVTLARDGVTARLGGLTF